MEDSQIIELFWHRDESAITETNEKYGRFCHSIAYNILSVHEDAEECVNDTWHKTWEAIPPERPNAFQAWLGRIVRNLSLDRWRKSRAKKRYDGMEMLLSEIEECIPSSVSVERQVEDRELPIIIDKWLEKLPRQERILFVRRYWNGDTVKALAAEVGIAPNKMAKQLYNLRVGLKAALEKEGVVI